ncbi:MAG: hypothetical protein A2Y80_01235 [Deltaproteobacteria bacterium RBG_13_58_19]|nr:MAG: hypothetical protein A2Y80_01235 [Deltaproteobacteria bacterium RBG_13_58_19]
MAAAEPVKTLLLKALEARLREIPEVATVFRWRNIPFDLAEIAKPVLFFWEEEEKEAGNRLIRGNLELWMQTFFTLDPEDAPGYTAFEEAAEVVAARIDNLLAAPGPLRAVGLIMAGPLKQKVIAQHNEEYGTIFLLYPLQYGHARGDACSLNY